MESSPLTLAHEHAKTASIATQTSDTTVAINEHALAAGEFAKAAAGIRSEEALRTLKLLEQHHQRLSQLLQFPTENLIVEQGLEKIVSTSAAVSKLRNTKKEAACGSSPRRTPLTASTMQIPRRMPPRDMSSSIASNLASARGIRSSHNRRALSPSVSTHQAPGSLEVPLRKSHRTTTQESGIQEYTHGKPSWVPPVHNQQSKADAQVVTTKASAVAEQVQSSAAEEGFQRFYSTFESLISKLSAPLAFAGLPLISEEGPITTEPVEASPRPKKPTNSRSAPSEPDLSKFISRAALRATSNPHPGNDSFYVVPTTGHTVSYAGILSFAEKEKRRLAASAHSENPDLFEDPDNDDFVDASETPVSQSPTFKRKLQGTVANAKGEKEMNIVVEELYIENKSLKDMIDKLSKRLHAFEMSAQQSSLALQESMRLMRPQSPAPASTSEASAKMAAKVKALEEQASAAEKEIQKLDRENEKLRSVVARYRERWEKLKEGVKTRRDGGSKDPQLGNDKDP